jgi:predicted RNA binding protein YcfA (HicA-like mRNA interferase family)
VSRLPSISGRKLIVALKRLGFEVIRIRGSHHYLQHPDGRATVVPVHASEDIGRGLLAKILRDTELTEAALKKHL